MPPTSPTPPPIHVLSKLPARLRLVLALVSAVALACVFVVASSLSAAHAADPNPEPTVTAVVSDPYCVGGNSASVDVKVTTDPASVGFPAWVVRVAHAVYTDYSGPTGADGTYTVSVPIEAGGATLNIGYYVSGQSRPTVQVLNYDVELDLAKVCAKPTPSVAVKSFGSTCPDAQGLGGAVTVTNPGTEELTLNLLVDGTVVDTKTATSGDVWFTHPVGPGTYPVSVAASTPSGWTQTLDVGNVTVADCTVAPPNPTQPPAPAEPPVVPTGPAPAASPNPTATPPAADNKELAITGQNPTAITVGTIAAVLLLLTGTTLVMLRKRRKA